MSKADYWPKLNFRARLGSLLVLDDKLYINGIISQFYNILFLNKLFLAEIGMFQRSSRKCMGPRKEMTVISLLDI